VTYYYYKDEDRLWRWKLAAGNNRIIADSGESYYNLSDCLAAIGLVKGSNNAPVVEAK